VIYKRSFFKSKQYKVTVFTKYSTNLTFALYRHDKTTKDSDYSIVLYVYKSNGKRFFYPVGNSPVYTHDSCYKTDVTIHPGFHTYTIIVAHSDPFVV
jgi:hypothetical protein